MKLSTHQLAHMLLTQKDQPVYTCDYAGPEGELSMYPVTCVDSNLIQDGTVICTGEEGIPFHQFVPVDPVDDQFSPDVIRLLMKSKEDIQEGRTFSLDQALGRLDAARAERALQ